MTGCSNWRSIILTAWILGAAAPAFALDKVRFDVEGGDKALTSVLQDASLLAQYARGSKLPAQDLIAKARAEYARLLDALYGQGYYGGEISVLVDGREAANIAVLDPPNSISTIIVRVKTGPAFVFGQAKIDPVTSGVAADIAQTFTKGAPAKSAVIVDSATAAIEAWRALGYAKAEVASSDLVADHQRQTVDADIQLDRGPRLKFGPLVVKGEKSMRTDRILTIAGLPVGERFSPEELARVEERLRRTGVFRSVTITEAKDVGPNQSLPITAVLVEEKVRRLALRADIASLEGLSLGVSGAHRNLFGGAERLTLAASATRIGVDTGGLDYTLSANFERPATFSPDTTFAIGIVFDREKDVGTTIDALGLSTQLTQYFSNTLTGNGGLSYDISRAADPSGVTIYRSLSFPFGLSWDTRNAKKSASDGVFITADVKPFVGFGQTENGVRSKLDARGYLGATKSDSLVLAARVQMGMFSGSSLAGSPREDLFFSGGPATVRGQPYKSLGVLELKDSSGKAFQTGGTHYLGGTIEARQRLSDAFGMVAFLDAGRIDAGGFFNSAGNWHAGAGIGIRYLTAVGPVRLDLAGPIGGATGKGGQIYVGLGQAF
ncbi:MAG: autotransporter assembly complex family protein [Cypionkella sp.]|nr:autotransporter assembly complex family protein [Cypionkella sp.]